MIAALFVGTGGAVAGPWVLVRTRRQRKLLAAEPWRSVPIQYLEIPYGNTRRGLLLVREDGAEHVGTVVSLIRWNLARTGLREASEADIVGRLPGHVVTRAPGGTRLVSVRSSYTDRGTRRWAMWFGSAG